MCTKRENLLIHIWEPKDRLTASVKVAPKTDCKESSLDIVNDDTNCQYLQLHSCSLNITEVDTKCQYLQQHQCCLHCGCWHKVSVPSTALMCSKCCECWHKVSVPSTWSCMAMINCHHLQLRTTGVRGKSQAIARYFSPKHPQSPPNQRAKRSNYRNLNLTLIDIKNSPYSWLRKPRKG